MPAFAPAISIAPRFKNSLPEFYWRDICEPGAYLEKGSGDLYRIPEEALFQGGAIRILKESVGPSRLIQISKNPFIITHEARVLACEHNIRPNF